MKKIYLAVLLMAALPLFSFNTHHKNADAWEKLGSKRVDFAGDHDVISVGRFEGFFTALQIRMKRGSINMQRMQVVFGNGQVKDIPLKNNFNEGDASRVIDLPGNVRVIREVDFWYDTKGFEGKRAIVELYGRH